MNIGRMNRRRFPRVASRHFICLQTQAGQIVHGCTLDLSLTGIRLEHAGEAPPEGPVEALLILASEVVPLRGRIVRAESREAADPARERGLTSVDLSPASRRYLLRLAEIFAAAPGLGGQAS